MQRTRLRRAIDALIALDLVIAGLALLAMLFHVVLDVVLREVHVPFSGTLEIVSFWYMVALVFLAIPVAQQHGHHIRVELFTAAVSTRVQQGIDLLRHERRVSFPIDVPGKKDQQPHHHEQQCPRDKQET